MQHILFVIAARGFLPRHIAHLSLSHRPILQWLHAATYLTNTEQRYALSTNTYGVSSVLHNPHCNTLVISSRCRFLCHQPCLCDFMNNNENSIRFQNSCQGCGRISVKLTSRISSGYRNFVSFLQDRGYYCLNHPTNQSPWLNHGRRNNAIPGCAAASGISNSLPNFSNNPLSQQPMLGAGPQDGPEDVWKTCYNIFWHQLLTIPFYHFYTSWDIYR